MRAFDLRTSFLDENGKPLVGRIKFCKLHTTELENIYNSEEDVITNPIFTNTIGQTIYQVFLQDKTSYTIYFEKYIGNSIMSEDPDPQNWLFQYSADDLWDTYNIEVESEGYQLVNNIIGLRALDPNIVQDREGIKIIELGGYNELGDKPTVRYIFDENSNEDDNGGSIIKPAGYDTGRWILVNDFNYETGVDVRHFGVFGEPTMNPSSTINLQLTVAIAYAAEVNLPLYFPCIDGLTWYKINGESITGAIFAEETRVFNTSTTPTTLYITDENSKLDCFSNENAEGSFIITGEVVRTSWGVNTNKITFNPSTKLIIDGVMRTHNRTFSNIEIYVLTPTSSLRLDNCVIFSNHNIGESCSFHNCTLKESYFSAGVDVADVYEDDIIELEDFPTTQFWINLKQQLSVKPFDFKGRTLTSSERVSWVNDCEYQNAVFDGYDFVQKNVVLKNCTGTGTWNVVNRVSLTLDNTNISMSSTNSNFTTLTMNNSTVSFGSNQTITNLSATKSTLNDVNNTYYSTSCGFVDSVLNVSISTTNFLANNCYIYKNVYCNVPTIHKSYIYGEINQQTFAQTCTFDLTDNIWEEGGKHIISASMPNTIVAGRWVGNTSNCSYHFIFIDRTYIDLDEQHHTYIYENNSGVNVLQRYSAKWNDTVIIDSTLPISTPKRLSFVDGYGYYTGAMYNVSGGLTNPDSYLTQFQIFTVGTQNIGAYNLSLAFPQHFTDDMTPITLYLTPFIVDSISLSTPVDEIERPWYPDNVGTPKGLYFVGGYTWKVTSVWKIIQIGNSIQDAHWEIPARYSIEKF